MLWAYTKLKVGREELTGRMGVMLVTVPTEQVVGVV